VLTRCGSSEDKGWQSDKDASTPNLGLAGLRQLRPIALTVDHGPSNPFLEMSMTVNLIERSPVRVAYRRHVGPYGLPINHFWMQEVAPWIQAHGLHGRPRYGISHDDPSITDPGQCRYDAAVEVDEHFAPGIDVFITTLPGGRYASMPFVGTSDQIGPAWQTLLRDWLAHSGLQLDARPCFEHYPVDATFDPASGRFSCNIVIPVVAL
jgi:AraC family transcriptional regulator